MRKQYLFLLSLLFTTVIFSQADTTKISFVAYWSVGDSYDFNVTKSTQQWKKNELTKDQKQNYKANFTVIDSTADSYTIKWSFENKMAESLAIPNEFKQELTEFSNIEVIYKTSELGDFLEIVNWEEISGVMTSTFDKILNLSSKDDDSKEMLNRILQPIKQIYSSKEGIESLVLKEIQYFHFPMGLEYDITVPIEYEEEIPNMFGGKPIKANGIVHFEDVDIDGGFCVVKQELSLDPKDTSKMLQTIFKTMKLNNKELKNAFKNSNITITDTNIYEYYFYPGIPHRIETTRESIININNEDGKRIEKIIIELIYNE